MWLEVHASSGKELGHSEHGVYHLMIDTNATGVTI